MKAHIELMGLPGSGKTTIYETIAKSPSQKDQRICSLKKALWLSLKRGTGDLFWKPILKFIPDALGKQYSEALFSRTTDFSKSFTLFCSTNSALHTEWIHVEGEAEQKTTVLHWIMNLWAQYQFITDNLSQKESLLLDEGFAQRALTLFGYQSSLHSQRLQTYTDAMPAPTLLYVVEGNLQLNESRMQQRNKGFPKRMKTLSPQERERIYGQCQQIIDHMIPILKKRGTQIIRVSNLENLEVALRQITPPSKLDS